MAEENTEETTPDLRLHLSPKQLKNHSFFQKHFSAIHPYLIDLLFWLQRQQYKKEGVSLKEAGRRVIIIDEFILLLNGLSQETINPGVKQQAHKKLHTQI